MQQMTDTSKDVLAERVHESTMLDAAEIVGELLFHSRGENRIQTRLSDLQRRIRSETSRAPVFRYQTERVRVPAVAGRRRCRSRSLASS